MRKLIYILFMVTTMLNAEEVDTSWILKAHAPAAFFTDKEPLVFSVRDQSILPVRWVLYDWSGKTLDSGEWKTGLLQLPALPHGYYTLALGEAGSKRSFAICPDPAARKHNSEGYFAMDSAQSILIVPDNNPRKPDNADEIVAETALRCGARFIRDRLKWNEYTENPRGNFQWTPFLRTADLMKKRGIPVSRTYHSAPSWAKSHTSQLPGNLIMAYAFANKVSGSFNAKDDVWEFWNEQDIEFASESAWDYASALKASYLGFKAGNPDQLVALGGLAIASLAPYDDVLMENQAGEYFDIFNVHTYDPLSTYPDMMQKIHGFMKKYSLSNRYLWFTENGCKQEGSAVTESFIPGIKAHSAAQEMLVAEHIPKMMIILQSLGVDKDFAFILPPFNEQGGRKDWGFMRRDYTVKPAVVAFSNLTYTIGNAQFLGTMDLRQGIRTFLYGQPDGTQTLVYWSESELDTLQNLKHGIPPDNEFSRTFSMNIKDDGIKGANVFGTPFNAKVMNGKLVLTATRMPSYLNGLTGLIPDQPFKKIVKEGAPAGKLDKTIVFRIELTSDFELASGKDAAYLLNSTGKLKLQVFNFSDKTKTGKIIIDGCSCSGIPETVTIKPFEKTEYMLKIKPDFNASTGTGIFRVTGMFNGKQVSCLFMPLINDIVKQRSRTVEFPQMNDPANWHLPSDTVKAVYDITENAVCFKAHFPDNTDKWVVPEYQLQLPQESLAKASGITFEVKTSIPSPRNWQFIIQMIPDSENNKIRQRLPLPDKEWQERIIRFGNIDPAKITKLRFGLNALDNDFLYWIRNVKICYEK